MLSKKLELLPQECTGNYLLLNVRLLATQALMATFENETSTIMSLTQAMILQNYESPDYL